MSSSAITEARAYYREMESTGKDVLARIDRRLKAVGLSQNAASIKSGMSRDAIRNLRRSISSGEQRGVSTETLAKLAPVLKTTSEWLISEAGPEEAGSWDISEDLSSLVERQTVPIIGFVSAGQAKFYGDDTRFDEVPAPLGSSDDTVAVEVRGTSLGALLDRSLVFYDDVRSPVTDDLVGRLCVVWLDDDRVLIKQLQRGRNGLFTLVSNTSEDPPLQNVRVLGAARVKAMVPR